jgi:hypothetical protein
MQRSLLCYRSLPEHVWQGVGGRPDHTACLSFDLEIPIQLHYALSCVDGLGYDHCTGYSSDRRGYSCNLQRRKPGRVCEAVFEAKVVRKGQGVVDDASSRREDGQPCFLTLLRIFDSVFPREKEMVRLGERGAAAKEPEDAVDHVCFDLRHDWATGHGRT